MKSMTRLMIVAMALIVAALVVAPAAARTSYAEIASGDVIYTYETGLDFTNIGAGDVDWIAMLVDDDWAAAEEKYPPIFVDNPADFDVLQSYIDDRTTGKYFLHYAGAGAYDGTYVFIQKPTIAIDVMLYGSTSSLDGKTIAKGNTIDFKIQASTQMKDTLGNYYGAVQVQLTTPGGGKINHISGADLSDLEIMSASMRRPTVLYGGTDGIYLDPVNVESGTYSASGLWVAPAGLKAYDTTLQSDSVTFTVSSQQLTIESNKDTVIRNNRFVTTISGEASSNYWVYIKSAALTDAEMYPVIAPGQPGVSTFDGITSTENADYGVFNAADWLVFEADDINDYPTASDGPVNTWNVWGAWFGDDSDEVDNAMAVVKTSASGTRTIEWITGAATDERTFTVKVVDTTDPTNYDTVKVKVEKGAVTVTASGDQSYYLGEEVVISGTNTDSQTVYLFITGPNLPGDGGYIDNPGSAIAIGVRTAINVETDDTWEYNWDTNAIDIDAGTYTIYATNLDIDKSQLSADGVVYDSVSVVIKKPFVTAKPSASTVAQGDDLIISGLAEGNPDAGLRVWVLGKNYFGPGTMTIGINEYGNYDSVSVEDDGTYEYELETDGLYAGQYYVIVQHPMYNGQFDVRTVAGANQVIVQKSNGDPDTNIWTDEFVIDGSSSLQGSDAAQALEDIMNIQYIDDYPAKTQFLVEQPWILIDTVGTKTVGSTFTITGTTNLAVGDELLVDIYSSSFTATSKSDTSGFSGDSQTVEVVEGDDYNEWSMEVDASTWIIDEYIISVESVETTTTTTGLFNIVAPTATATATTTTATTTTPGFGVLIALAGLGAVAFLVMRKH